MRPVIPAGAVTSGTGNGDTNAGALLDLLSWWNIDAWASHFARRNLISSLAWLEKPHLNTPILSVIATVRVLGQGRSASVASMRDESIR